MVRPGQLEKSIVLLVSLTDSRYDNGFSPISVCTRIIWFEVKLSPGKEVLTACRKAGATDKSYFDHFAIQLPAPPRLQVVW